jgi:tetratricopeptide (TPR) repeat protein
MVKSRNPRRLTVGLAIALLLIGGFLVHRLLSAAAQERHTADYGSEMIQYTKEGRYDDAIQTGLNALRNQPKDAAVYQQIVVVYLIRADKDPTERQRWILQALSYIEKALSADPSNPIMIRELAFDLEKAGDLSSNEKCQYYGHAFDLSKRVAALLEGDHITAGGQAYPIDPISKDFVVDGHTFRIEPLQRANGKLSDSLRAKMVTAKCG